MIPWVCHFRPRSSDQLCRSVHLIFSGHTELFQLRGHIIQRNRSRRMCVCVSISLYLCIYPISISLYFSILLSLSFYHIYLFIYIFLFKGNGSHNCGGLVSQHLMGEAGDLGVVAIQVQRQYSFLQRGG